MDFSKVKEWQIPEGKVKSVSVGGVVIWKAKTEVEALSAPTISLDGDTLTIMATDERTETFAILVDGEEVATVAEKVTVSGTWYFNEQLNLPCPDQSVNFTSNNTLYDTIYSEIMSFYYVKDGDIIAPYDREPDEDSKWVDEAYRTITFDGVQTVSKDFYDWLVANAEPEIISFTIEDAHSYDTTTYNAIKGMTWAEWCDSEYNTRGGFIMDDGTVMVWCYPSTPEYNSGLKNGLKDVLGTDVISDSSAYVATADGACMT